MKILSTDTFALVFFKIYFKNKYKKNIRFSQRIQKFEANKKNFSALGFEVARIEEAAYGRAGKGLLSRFLVH